ncbi:MAG: zinc dependent phospholipase C family protein [Oscillospiraceae bacterium]|nr:zinc dependent phospholipase C family protein [Oscillospiraceae bacterium]
MPSTYAHYRMGCDVIKRLSPRLKRIIIPNRRFFDIGLHGPDILFYYYPVLPNHVNLRGYSMHRSDPARFFSEAADIIRSEHQVSARGRMTAYIMGFICHYILDKNCHGLIYHLQHKEGIAHSRTESAFERKLLVKDGYDPLKKTVTGHIVPSSAVCRIIARFFKGISASQIKRSLKNQVFYCNTLVTGSYIKRFLLKTLFLFTGCYGFFRYLLISRHTDKTADKYCGELMRLYNRSTDEAVYALGLYYDHLYGKRPVKRIKGFKRDFRGRK